MFGNLYARWMYRWETALTTRDENRIVRPVEWGFDWLEDFIASAGLRHQIFGGNDPASLEPHDAESAMVALNEAIVQRSEAFYSYRHPTDFRLKRATPSSFPPTSAPKPSSRMPNSSRQAADRQARSRAQFLRFTSPVRTPYPENDFVNARWYPAPPENNARQAQAGHDRHAAVERRRLQPQRALHALQPLRHLRLRLSKPYHDIRRPAELERSDYAVSSNIGRTISACRQAVVDIRCCLDWLEAQGYEQFGVLGTSLGSCYAFIAAAHDPRLQVNAFNHASTSFGDVVWTGQSTRHIRAGL